ncbi:MAG: enoyl-CoA hydratase [Hyphomicrobiales bacterium]|jgi:enoyl-CoA hydratase|nr:enoyl-CoA hydratase [Hyphomicrobiales bacterium]
MIDVTSRGDIAILTMVHGKANALTTEFCDTLAARVRETTAARAIVITGAGRIFSAGVDLPRLLAGGPSYAREFLPALHRLYDTIFFHPKPVVAAVNGHAVAGGCVLACAADARLMADNGTRIGVTELLVGVPFPPLAFEIMRYATAPQFFPAVIFSGATFAPEDAKARGLIDEIAAPQALIDRAIAAAETLAALSPAAFALTKQQMRQPVAERTARNARDFGNEVTETWTAQGTLDHVRDYVARTLKK